VRVEYCYFRVAFSSLVCGLLLFFAPELSFWFIGEREFSAFLVIAILKVPFHLVVLFYQGLFRVKRAVWYFVALTLANTLLILVFNIFLVIILRLGVSGILLANLIASFLLAVFGFIWIRQDLQITFSNKHLKLLLKYGLPLVPASIAYWMLAYIDRYFLVNYTNLTEVGLYSISNRLSGVLTFFTSAFQMAWPAFAFSIKQADYAKEVYAKVLTFYTVCMCILAVGLSLFSKEILLIVTTPAYLKAYHTVGFLSLSIIAMGIFNILTIGTALAEKTKHIGWITWLAAILNIVLNFLLIPRFGIVGAALATLISFCFSSILLFLISQRYYPIPYETGKIVITILLSLVAVLLGLFIDRGTDQFQLLHVVEKIGLSVSLLLLFWLLKIVLTKEIIAGWNVVRQALTRIC